MRTGSAQGTSGAWHATGSSSPDTPRSCAIARDVDAQSTLAPKPDFP
ncbi:hypothetical protein J7400_13535 [Shimia sp. R9_2]|nr:hypothetical protein [Shimia sp. R9_2]MBO9397705.1 hypothetical protein [Shimia sp. R9_2]